jgi:hypothetical protein
MTVPATSRGDLPAAAASPTPAPAAASSPFSDSPFSNQPAPAKPAADNPFRDGAGNPYGTAPAAGGNPYASPAATAYAYRPQYFPGGPRPGLPWENEPQNIGCWFRTMGMVLGSPSYAFSIMRQQGGLRGPVYYNLYGFGIPFVSVGLLIGALVVAGLIAGAAAGPRNGAVQPVFGLALGGGLIGLGAVAIYILVIATLGMLIVAAIWHVLLMICGAAGQGFETTFRVTSYTYSSLMPLTVLSMCLLYLGMFAMSIWLIVLLIIGFSRAHETSSGRTSIAVLLPFGAMFALFVLFIVLGVSGAFE